MQFTTAALQAARNPRPTCRHLASHYMDAENI